MTTMDPAIARFVADSERFDPPDTGRRSLVEQRLLYEDYARAFAVGRPHGVTSQDGEIALDGRAIPLRLYRPRHASIPGSIVYAHGGGFVLGSLESHDGIAARLADAVGAPVIAVDYRLAPEHRFAAACDDVRAVATTLCEGGLPWPDLPRTRLGLAGDSAGGTLAAAVALTLGGAARDALCALAMVYPMLGFEPAEPARSRWAEAPMLTLADIHRFRDAALGSEAAAGAFPLDRDDLSGLPATVLLPAEIDPLRDDCTVLAERLRAIGTDVVLLPGTGLVHGALRALDRSAAMAEPFGDLCAFMAARLGR